MQGKAERNNGRTARQITAVAFSEHSGEQVVPNSLPRWARQRLHSDMSRSHRLQRRPDFDSRLTGGLSLFWCFLASREATNMRRAIGLCLALLALAAHAADTLDVVSIVPVLLPLSGGSVSVTLSDFVTPGAVVRSKRWTGRNVRLTRCLCFLPGRHSFALHATFDGEQHDQGGHLQCSAQGRRGLCRHHDRADERSDVRDAGRLPRQRLRRRKCEPRRNCNRFISLLLTFDSVTYKANHSDECQPCPSGTICPGGSRRWPMAGGWASSELVRKYAMMRNTLGLFCF